LQPLDLRAIKAFGFSEARARKFRPHPCQAPMIPHLGRLKIEFLIMNSGLSAS
jgi:hypothetical protein